MLRSRFFYYLSYFGVNCVTEGPTFVSVEPANYCMLRCPQCPVGMVNAEETTRVVRKQHRLMPWSVFTTIIDNIESTAHSVIFYFQGEPLLNKQLLRMIAYAHSKRLFTMLSTNGLLLSKEMADELVAAGLDRIIVSIDGLTQASYEAYRTGGRLEQALAGLRNIRAAKEVHRARIDIVLQCLRLKSNEHEWSLFQQQYKLLGADRLEMKTAQFYDFEEGNPLMPSSGRYSRYIKGKNGRYSRKKKYSNHCYRLWSGCVITTDGEVLPCCFDKEHTHSFGNILEIPFPWVWQTVEAQQFRQQLIRRREDIDICRNCTE